MRDTEPVFVRQSMTLLQPAEAYFDLSNAPLLVIALGLRRGAFKNHTNWDSLVEGDEYHIQWHDHLLDQPFFCAAGPGGWTIDYDRPMTSNAARAFLRQTAEGVGLGGQ
jgi:hypothetical protein